MESYNLYLYNRRMELGLKMRAFANMLGIRLFKYFLIENGYIKPGKKDIVKITCALDVDYAPYTEGAASYPGEKSDIRKPFLKFFNLLGSKVFRIIVLILCVLSLSTALTAEIIRSNAVQNPRMFYPEDYLELYDTLAEKGSLSYSFTGSFRRPEIYEVSEERYLSIKGGYSDNDLDNIDLQAVYWTERYRCMINLLYFSDNEPVYSISITEYDTMADLYYFYSDSSGFLGLNKVNHYQSIIREYVKDFYSDCERLIREKLGIDLTLVEVLSTADEIITEAKHVEITATIVCLLSLSAGLLLLFILIYAFVYGTKNGIGRNFSRRLMLYPGRKPLKKRDIRIFPFIPETAFEIIGIVLLGVASMRFQLYLVMAFLPAGIGLTTGEIKDIYEIMMLVFYMGMFLLYFIDFDLFMDDKRVLRNIAAYTLIFFGLYIVELTFLRMINSESLLFSMVEYKLPNMFGTISMYFWIIYLLYFTPKFIDTKKKLVVFRSLSAIPVVIIFGTYIIFNGANTSFGWNMPDWAYYLFASERIPFSLLCVSYLFGVFFLRLLFRKKYGDEAAAQYFNGNRFLFMKNILICLIVLLIAAFDAGMATIPGAKKWGFGYTYETVSMIPLLLFYHPHKGPRNRLLDYFILGLYMLAITGVLSFFVIFVL